MGLRFLQADAEYAGLGTPGYPELQATEIHIPVSPREYCCLSGPSDAMASLGPCFLQKGLDPRDPVPERDEDPAARPDLSE